MLSTGFKNENMKSSSQKEESGDKKRYVFFSDPDVIVKRAETSAVAAQITRDTKAHQQTFGKQSVDEQVPTLGIRNLEKLLSYHPIQPYPFTFISAVKQKLALGDCTDVNTKAYDPNSQGTSSLTSSLLKANSTQNLYQIVQKMDFIRPLKVPDLKISPKTLNFSNRENSTSKELVATKSDIAAREFEIVAKDKSDKTLRTNERVQRKLEFSSSDGSSIINCESIEPLKAPNVSIASNLSKKKEHIRDSSREKENKSKRMKKDDSICTKRDESAQDQVKRSRSPRHISRKDTSDISNVRLPLPKNDRPFHATRNDFLPIKSKDKNYITSTVKKDNEKRQRSFNIQCTELTKDNPLESKSRISNNESSALSLLKVPEKVTLRDNNNILSSNTENKSKDMYICHSIQRPEMEDLKYKSDSDNRQVKQDKSNIHKEQTKKAPETKICYGKVEGKLHDIDSEPSENSGSISETDSSKNRMGVYPISSTQLSKSHFETSAESKQSINSTRSTKASESFKYTESSATPCASISAKKNESFSQSIVTSKETITNDDSNNVDDNTLPESLFDPRKISFRDDYTQQEFCNLTTPEKMNLVLRSKRRKYWMQNSDSEIDAKCLKHKPPIKSEKEQDGVQLIHPTALHMQFQAELQLYDSFNESIRQVTDVEQSLYNTKREQEQKNSQKVDEKCEELEKAVGESRIVAAVGNDIVEKMWDPLDYTKKDVGEIWISSDEAHFKEHYIPNQANVDESNINRGKFNKAIVKVAEVQTQTVNDIATQTDILADTQDRLPEIHENIYERSFSVENEVPQLSLDSAEQFEDLDQIEGMSLPSRIRTMSEISLHETTSSIKTETGTEISISTRDVTCSFNQYLGSEIAQLIKDEKQRCYKIEEFLKSREKTLYDKTKKLEQLEEQKRALKDTGQDIRPFRKKQRALVLKLQQEKDEFYRLKELYKITSQERRRILQEQRDMFNPQMSTKNILTKLKRSADSQSPRRLSGPMKGYDIRSNSSMSSLIDSDKSQHDRSHVDTHLQASESNVHSSKFDLIKTDKSISLVEESNTSAIKFDDLTESKDLHDKSPVQKRSDIPKYELRSRKYEEKMPRADILRQKQNQLDMETKRIQGHPMKIKRLLENQEPIGLSQSSKSELNASVPDYVKSESDTLVEELSKRSKTSQEMNPSIQTATIATEKDLISNIITVNSESIGEETSVIAQDTISKMTKSSQVSEDILQTNTSKSSKKTDKSVGSNRDISKKLQPSAELKPSSKRKNSKHQKTKSSSSTLTENILRSKLSPHVSEESVKHHDKRTKIENELFQVDNDNESSILDELDLNENQNSLQILDKHSKIFNTNLKSLGEIVKDYESKENASDQISNRKLESDESPFKNERSARDVSTSQISTFAISHHSSGESEKNFAKSIIVRSEDRDFEQILSARETALASRKNCVEEWMAWHARLRAEEDRVTRMEQAAFKLVAASNVLSQQDTTVSSDTSDVEGRIGLLTEKLAERRIEMARLKKEAKKQAKKQLRVLEANLLNQIKKYDTTIHEMRKKLESKKSIKETDKLAIEPKSLADFKVPEIPLKRIQDIYKSSDLLRSRSESDLLSTKNQQKDLLKIINPVKFDNKHESDSSQISKSANIKSPNASKLKGITNTNHSNQIIFDEYTSAETYDKIQTATSISISNDTRSGKYPLSTEKQMEGSIVTETERHTISSDAEDAQTNISSVKSGLEVQTTSNAKFENHSTINTESTDRLMIDLSHARTLTIESEIQEVENVDYSKSVANSSIFTYSRKLDFLQLNNKNLSEDISSIENDIKALSEIMSRLSSESNEKSKTDNDNERNTSQDISEIISKSVFNDKITDVANEKKQTISSEKEINIESLSISTNDEKSESPNDLSHNKYTPGKTNSEISTMISGEVPALSNSVNKIDYEAKSKEIMNEIEKSIISEHNKIVRADYNVTSVLKNDEGLLNDLVSELDIKSISEILSKVSESRKSLDLATNKATQIINDSKKSINEQSDLNETKSEENLTKNQEKKTHLSKFFEDSSVRSIHSPIIAGHRSKESPETDSQGDFRSTRSTVSNRASHVLANENVKSLENIPKVIETRIDIVEDIKILKNLDKDVRTTVLDDTVNLMIPACNADQNKLRAINTENISHDKEDWTTSDSFEVPQDEISTGKQEEFENTRSHLDRMKDSSNNFSKKSASRVDDATDQNAEANLINDVDVSAFIPKGESVNIETHDITFNNALAESHAIKSNDVLDDILDIIARENDQEANISNKESERFDNVISNSVAELLDKVKDIVENDGKSADSPFKGILCDTDISGGNRIEISDALLNSTIQSNANVKDISKSNIISGDICDDNKFKEVISLQAIDDVGDKSAINSRVEIDNEESPREVISETQGVIITELDSDSIEDNVLSELEIDVKIELAEEEESATSYGNENKDQYAERENKDVVPVEIKECLESILEQDSSDGEQLDNLVEIIESGLDTVEKLVSTRDSSKSIINDAISMMHTEEETIFDTSKKNGTPKALVRENLNKTFDILKDPEYEDISEESLEVSEILDKNELPKANVAKRSDLPEKYQTTQRSEEVLRILDEISRNTSPDSISNSQKNEKSAQNAMEEISELLGAEVSAKDDNSFPEMNRMTTNEIEEGSYQMNESRNRLLKRAELQDKVLQADDTSLSKEKNAVSSILDEHNTDDKLIYELRERVSQLQEQDGSSESSEAGDTPRGVSEIELDSPRDFNDSRLDIDVLDDDLLSGTKASQSDVKTNFHTASIVATSEKDIEAMIDKLKASLEQPGLEVPELEAKLLRIEQLQIELEIKKLEAEEVSYYVREIPNKPPPPYTPPGDGRLSTSLGSSSLVTAVIPSNIDELTSFTEKAMSLIYNAKLAGEDVASLEAPPEIHELIKDKNEIVKRDRRIYNTFLFDLCKETVVDVYRTEYENPGPSWTKPNVKTKPTVKSPKDMDELIEYVNKEVATLFGFKTKLQRENMVMRWSRKRRDRVDELLAREAQAEEDEWTKFHHDELAVKNGLTAAILDTLVMETADKVKIVYGKKRRMMM